MNKRTLYVCKHCGNIVAVLEPSGVPVICCGEAMTAIVPNTVDASVEKHVPVVTAQGDGILVKIGAQMHPMTAEHYIKWVYVLTNKGSQLKYLDSSDAPEVAFSLSNGEKAEAVYAFCNLHGLWMTAL